ncbi:VOC family protein [Risungbinella massiliensis]|uniref:VOC family protein n=1 Tax=Risungbinella massiliensis TaxID=1329796 RepID=UPI0005CBF1F2|nr:VOC family protein [Risungbinella massiliensis]
MTLRLTPYIILNGSAKEAIQFYENVLDAKVQSIATYGDMPDNPDMPFSEEVKQLVAHALLKVGDSDLMISDTPIQSEQSFHLENQVVTICISTHDVEKSKQIFNTLQQEGKVNCPLEETSFSSAFGNVTDKYGVTYNIVTDCKE